MIEALQFLALLGLLVFTVQRNRRIIGEIRLYERRTRALNAQATALAVEVERRKDVADQAGKLLDDLKAKIQRLQDTYVAERRRLVNVKRIPSVALWTLDRNPAATLPLWYLRATDRADGRGPRSLASVGSTDTEDTLPELRPAYVVAATSPDDAQRQLKARLTSIEFEITETRPLKAAVSQLTAPRRNAGKAG